METFPSIRVFVIAASKNANPLRVRWFFAHFFLVRAQTLAPANPKKEIERAPVMRKYCSPRRRLSALNVFACTREGQAPQREKMVGTSNILSVHLIIILSIHVSKANLALEKSSLES